MVNWEIICGSSDVELNKLGNERGEFVDLVVTSPPYDTLRKYSGQPSDYDYTMLTQRKIIHGLKSIMKEGAVCVWICADKVVNGSETGSSFVAVSQFMEEGFRLHDTMIWRKTKPMPRVKTKRYFDCFEYMFVFSKGAPKTFNPLMVECKFGGKTYNSTCRNMGVEIFRTKKTFVLNKTRVMDNIWDIAVAQNKTKHPAVFPEQLALNHILSWSNEEDTVLDPFCGSGTTGVAAVKANRNFVGIEISNEYCELATDRIKANDELTLF